MHTCVVDLTLRPRRWVDDAEEALLALALEAEPAFGHSRPFGAAGSFLLRLLMGARSFRCNGFETARTTTKPLCDMSSRLPLPLIQRTAREANPPLYLELKAKRNAVTSSGLSEFTWPVAIMHTERSAEDRAEISVKLLPPPRVLAHLAVADCLPTLLDRR